MKILLLKKILGAYMLFEDLVFAQRGKQNTLFQRRIHALLTCCVKIHFITSYVPNSKFKLHRTHKFCRTYELQYTHCFFWEKTEDLSPLLHFRALLKYPLLPSECTYFLNGPIVHANFIADFDIL